MNGFFDSSEKQISQPIADDGFLSVNALALQPQSIGLSTQRQMDGRALKEEQEDESLYDGLAHNFNRLSIDPAEGHYYGKSSTPMLIQTAIEVRKDFARKEDDKTPEPVINIIRDKWDFRRVRPLMSRLISPLWLMPFTVGNSYLRAWGAKV